jgi:hypothetical protein
LATKWISFTPDSNGADICADGVSGLELFSRRTSFKSCYARSLQKGRKPGGPLNHEPSMIADKPTKMKGLDIRI